MDYKYIEQLIERYWACDTSLEEERILHTFFSQKEVPAELEKYRALFGEGQAEAMPARLSDGFEDRILEMVEGRKPGHARVIAIRQRMMPLFRAVAIVAIILTLGNVANVSIQRQQRDSDINYASYQDTFSDPATAYDKVENALELVSEGISQTQCADTAAVTAGAGSNDSSATE